MEQLREKFKDHELKEILKTENVSIFEFRNKDGNSHCYQRWIIDRGTLIVTGDNYSSIYKWNDSNISLEFLSKCNLEYFSSKCQADKDGSNQEVYDEQEAEIYLKEIAVERLYENELYNDIPEEIWNKMILTEKLESVKTIICQQLDIDEYDLNYLFYQENTQKAYDFLTDPENEFMFGIDAWEYGRGLMILSMIPKIHLTALRVAYEKYPNAF